MMIASMSGEMSRIREIKINTRLRTDEIITKASVQRKIYSVSLCISALPPLAGNLDTSRIDRFQMAASHRDSALRTGRVRIASRFSSAKAGSVRGNSPRVCRGTSDVRRGASDVVRDRRWTPASRRRSTFDARETDRRCPRRVRVLAGRNSELWHFEHSWAWFYRTVRRSRAAQCIRTEKPPLDTVRISFYSAKMRQFCQTSFLRS